MATACISARELFNLFQNGKSASVPLPLPTARHAFNNPLVPAKAIEAVRPGIGAPS
jgi:hypothetical protein